MDCIPDLGANNYSVQESIFLQFISRPKRKKWPMKEPYRRERV